MIAFDKEHKEIAKEKGKILFRFEIDRRYADKEHRLVRNHQLAGMITPEMDKEFNELINKWHSEGKF